MLFYLLDPDPDPGGLFKCGSGTLGNSESLYNEPPAHLYRIDPPLPTAAAAFNPIVLSPVAEPEPPFLGWSTNLTLECQVKMLYC